MANSDIEQLADRLAGEDASAPGQPDPTLQQLRTELETLAGEVRKQPSKDSYREESALWRGLHLIKAIGHQLSSRAAHEQPAGKAHELDSLRDYKLLAKLGEGGMGAVYEALHTKLGKVVAIKVISPQRTRDEAVVQRFEREMRAIGKLEHPNIVRATDAGEVDGRHFLVMELVDGVDLSRLIRTLGPLWIPDACELVRQAAIGLQEAHEYGLIHRDIKPSNLMLAAAGRGQDVPTVKILDLGLALLSETSAERRELTATGQLMGTLDYMSPEQATDSHVVDTRSDIYSLGATLYKLLCGETPLAGPQYNTPSKVIVALATEPLPSLEKKLPAAPKGLISVVDRMLAKAPADRYATPLEVAEALAPFAEGADLVTLLERAQITKSEGTIEPTLEVTRDAVRSASVETDPSIDLQGISETGSTDRSARRWLVVGATALLAALLLGVIVIVIRHKDGPAVVTIDNEKDRLRVTVEGDGTIAEVFQDGRQIDVTPSVPLPEATPPSPPANDERALAEWLLSLGANFGVNVDGLGYVQVRPGEKLPHGSIRVVNVDVAGRKELSDDDLRRFNNKPSLVSLIAGDTSIGDAGLRQLAAPKLQKLFLHNTRVTDQGLTELQRFPALRVLHLTGTTTTDAGLKRLAPLSELVELNLGRCPVTDAGLLTLYDLKNLRTVWLNGTQVTADGIAALRFGLPNRSIHSDVPEDLVAEAIGKQQAHSRLVAEWVASVGGDLSVIGEGLGFVEVRRGEPLPDKPFHMITSGFGAAKLLADDDLARFDKLPIFGTFNLNRTSIGDDGLRQLGELPWLRNLYLYDTRITDAGLAELKRYPRLSALHVQFTGVTDEGLRHLAAFPKLFELDLGGCQITDAGLARLYRLSNLRTLRLKKTKVTADGIAKLKMVLPECNVESDFTSDEVETAINRHYQHHREVAQWLVSVKAQFGVVTEGQGFVDVEPGDALPAARFRVATANVAYNKSIVDRDLALLKDLPLFTTFVASATTIGDEGLRLLDVPLEELFLWNTRVTDHGLSELRRFPNLSRLHLGDTAVTDEGLRHLAACTKLSEIDLVRCRITDAGLAHLHELYRLQTLRLSGTNVTALGLARFQAYLPNCKVVSDVSDTDVAATTSEMQSRSREVARWLSSAGVGFAISGKGIGFTPMNPGDALPDGPFHIMGFHVKQPGRFGDNELARVGDLPVANTLVLNQTSVSDAGLERLGNLPLLTRLYLSGTKVGDRGLAELQRYSNLAVLHLTDTAVTDAGLENLGSCKSIRVLDLVRCQVTDTGLTHLYGLPHLQTIRLYETGVTAEGVEALEKALSRCKVEWK